MNIIKISLAAVAHDFDIDCHNSHGIRPVQHNVCRYYRDQFYVVQVYDKQQLDWILLSALGITGAPHNNADRIVYRTIISLLLIFKAADNNLRHLVLPLMGCWLLCANDFTATGFQFAQSSGTDAATWISNHIVLHKQTAISYRSRESVTVSANWANLSHLPKNIRLILHEFTTCRLLMLSPLLLVLLLSM